MKTLISNLRVNFAVLLMIVAVSSLSAAQQWGPDSPRALQAFPGINGGSFASEAPNRIIQLAELSPSDPKPNSYFGSSVSISGDVAIVGAPTVDVGNNHAQGAAYVFVKPESGWTNGTQTAILTASDGAAEDYFGTSVSIDGDTVVVGASDATVNSNYRQGAAYVFVKPPTGWSNMTETAKLTVSSGQALDFFGVSAGVSRNTVVVGANGVENATGAAYIFLRPALGWSDMNETATLTASNAAATSYFGNAVSISLDTVAVGAPDATVGSNEFQGAAYVFVRPATGWANMAQTAEMTASDGSSDNSFGYSVAIDDNTLVVGATFNLGQGAAYVYVRPEDGWIDANETAKLSKQFSFVADEFGYSVAVNRHMALIGGIGINSWAGAAYAYLRPAGGWVTTSNPNGQFLASDKAKFDFFGSAVAIGDSVALVGADAAGKAYIFGPNTMKTLSLPADPPH